MNSLKINSFNFETELAILSRFYKKILSHLVISFSIAQWLVIDQRIASLVPNPTTPWTNSLKSPVALTVDFVKFSFDEVFEYLFMEFEFGRSYLKNLWQQSVFPW